MPKLAEILNDKLLFSKLKNFVIGKYKLDDQNAEDVTQETILRLTSDIKNFWLFCKSDFKGSSLFSIDDFKRPGKFIKKLRDSSQDSDRISLYLKAQLMKPLQQQISEYKDGTEPSKDLLEVIIPEFNRLLTTPLYQQGIFAEVKLPKKTRILFASGRNYQGGELLRLNRLLLEDTYPYEISRSYLKGIVNLIIKLREAAQNQDYISLYLKEKLPTDFQQQIMAYRNGEALSKRLLDGFLIEFNGLLGMSLYQQDIFAKLVLSKKTKILLSHKNNEMEELLRLNRFLLEDIYPNDIEKTGLIINKS